MKTTVGTSNVSASLQFFDRMCRFASLQNPPDVSNVWREVSDNLHSRTLNLAKAGEALKLAEHFSKIYQKPDLIGLDIPETFTDQEFENECLSMMGKIGNMLGCVPVHNPEQPVNHDTQFEQVFANFENHCWIPIHTNGCGAMRYCEIGGRKVTPKLLESCAIVLLCELEDWEFNFAEIGAGTGWLAYAFGLRARKLQSPLNYHTIDLPVVSLFQAYLLACEFGEKSVWFSGESWDPCKDSAQFFIHGNRGLPASPSLDCVLAVNSLPEFPKDLAVSILEKTCGRLKPHGKFCSFNHESTRGGQTTVSELMRSVSSMKQRQRLLYWLRVGYLQEVWQKM